VAFDGFRQFGLAATAHVTSRVEVLDHPHYINLHYTHFLAWCLVEFMQESYERSRVILKARQSELKQLAQALLKYETL